MSYAILRTAKLKSHGNIGGSLAHTFRTRETPNADSSRTQDNEVLHGPATAAGVHEALRGRLPDKHRKDAVLGIEYFVGASPEWFKDDQDGSGYFSKALEWLRERHGAENVVSATVHRDETSPHMVAYVVPRDESGRLNAKKWLGGKVALSKMQTDFASQVGAPLGLERGIEGSQARHTSIRDYYARANAPFEPLPMVTAPKPQAVRDEPPKPGLLAGKEARAAWEEDHAEWQREKATADAQQKARQKQVNVRWDAAMKNAKTYEAQAREVPALRAMVAKLKQSNSALAMANAQLHERAQLADLFRPAEIEQAKERRRQQEALQAKETSRLAAIKARVAERVAGLAKLLKDGGVPYIFARRATAALQSVRNDPAMVEWTTVEGATIRECLGVGHEPQKIVSTLVKHSPGQVDPAMRVDVEKTVQSEAARLEAERQQEATQSKSRSQGPRM